MRKHLSNGTTLALAAVVLTVVLAIVSGSIRIGKLEANIVHAKEQIKETTDQLEKRQEQYNNDMRLNAAFQASQLVRTDNMEKMLDRISRQLEKIMEDRP